MPQRTSVGATEDLQAQNRQKGESGWRHGDQDRDDSSIRALFTI